jgi:hypothetical protein
MSEAPKHCWVGRVLPTLGKEGVMPKRLRFKQVMPLVQRLTLQAEQLREEAKSLPPSGEREELIRKARQCDLGYEQLAG